jgi:hypothetical protein
MFDLHMIRGLGVLYVRRIYCVKKNVIAKSALFRLNVYQPRMDVDPTAAGDHKRRYCHYHRRYQYNNYLIIVKAQAS